MMFYNLIKRKLQKAINTELHFDKGVRHIKSVDTFLSPVHKGWNLCIKYTTEDDYFYFTYAYNLRTILFLLFSKGVEGYTRGDSEQDYLSIL